MQDDITFFKEKFSFSIFIHYLVFVFVLFEMILIIFSICKYFMYLLEYDQILKN